MIYFIQDTKKELENIKIHLELKYFSKLFFYSSFLEKLRQIVSSISLQSQPLQVQLISKTSKLQQLQSLYLQLSTSHFTFVSLFI